MTHLLFLILFFSLCLVKDVSSSSECAFGFANCGTIFIIGVGEVSIPCTTHDKPKIIDDKALLAQFDQLCPSLNVIENINDGLCCDASQIKQFLKSNDESKQILGGCPSCLINFSQLFCELSCSPRQSQFANVTKTSPFNQTQEAVEEVTYIIDKSFVDGLYESCKNVYSYDLKQDAIDLICGDSKTKCDPLKLVNHLGTKGVSPFNIKYNYTTDSKKPFIPCNTSVSEVYPRLKDFYKSRCSYGDCPAEVAPISAPTTSWFSRIGVLYIILTVLFISIIAMISTIARKYCPNYDRTTIDSKLKIIIERWAFLCARHPILVIFMGLLGISLSCVGLLKLEITTNPVDLWSQANSQAHQDKIYFDKTFGPFYRVEQVIARPLDGSKYWITYEGKNFTSVFKLDFLMTVLELQESILNINATYNGAQVYLKDICLQPMSNSICMVQSPLNWFGGKKENFHLKDESDESSDKNSLNYLKHFIQCSKERTTLKDTTYSNLSCLGPYGGPILPKVALAGYNDEAYWEANSLVITIPVKNDDRLDSETTKRAQAWEEEFINHLKRYNKQNLAIAFYSERSIEDEIQRQSRSDISTVAISYFLMFKYVAFSLGRMTSLKRMFIESRIALGLGGVLIVLASVFASIGILSFFDVPATLIIVEVIPFLVLAVGVDNIFIIVKALQRGSQLPSQINKSVERQISSTVGDVGPSILLATLSESSCFLIGALTPMPAVRVFAMTASLALLIAFVLQMTVFIAVLTLDTKRQLSNRYDIFCCLTASRVAQSEDAQITGSSQDYSSETSSNNNTSVEPVDDPGIDVQNSQTSDDIELIAQNNERDLLHWLFERYVAPNLMLFGVRIVAMSILVIWLCVSLFVIRSIDVGLDQSMSVPEDSYIQDYFSVQKNDLRVGPPVYFVLKNGLDFTSQVERRFVCGSSVGSPDSLVTQIGVSSNLKPTYIAEKPDSWIDTYETWASSKECCMVLKTSHQTIKKIQNYTELMLPDEYKFCPRDTKDKENMCESCDYDKFTPEVFYRFLKDNFLKDVPDPESCKIGGSALYSGLVTISKNQGSTETSLVIDSAFSSYHTPLKNSKDFIESMVQARSIAQSITHMLNSNLRPKSESSKKLEVFPYCFTYVFYEQYLTIWQLTVRNLSISIATIFVVTYLLMGCDLYISAVVVGTLASILINFMGLMYFWNIQLNAISLVNLVMAVGISVEFCSHIARAFALSPRTKPVDRAQDALVEMGSSVLSGITLTKIVGISILAFAKSKIFRVYYFRMYMGIVLVGALHGMVFMPIFFSLTARDRTAQQKTQTSNKQPGNAAD